MQEPPWYKAMEKWLLSHGGPFIALCLLVVALICVYLAYQIAINKKMVVPGAVFLTYLLMP